tara:strand:- start:26 stop:262 length:237 start_codon:yes stop_codon:yes gene_type:complete
MKDLQNSFIDSDKSQKGFDKTKLLKYLIMFAVVTTATLIIPTCGVLQSQAIYVGLIAASTFAIIDINFPNYVNVNGDY